MPTLFDPIQAGDLHLANRIAMAPLTRNRSPRAVPREGDEPESDASPPRRRIDARA